MMKKDSIDAKTKLERKRETDRKAQRASRAKTKAYIAFLESQASTLTENPKGGDLTESLKVQWEENQRLKNALQGIESLIKDVLEKQTSNEEQPKRIPPSPSSSNTALQDPSESVLPSSSTTEPMAFPYQIPSPDSALVCTSHGSRDYFTILSEALEFMELLGSDLPTPEISIDEDINIRAILHGWDSIPETSLDVGWRTLKLVDQGLFHRSGPVERIAILRVQRSMFLSSHNRYLENPRQRPPSYMSPTPLQLSIIPHARLIDYFSWPSIRDHLLINSISYALESIAAQFAIDVGFKWKYEARDVAKKDLGTGKYGFSRDFDEAFGELDSWFFRSESTARRFPREKCLMGDGMGMILEDMSGDCLGVGMMG